MRGIASLLNRGMAIALIALATVIGVYPPGADTVSAVGLPAAISASGQEDDSEMHAGQSGDAMSEPAAAPDDDDDERGYDALEY